LDLRIRLFVLSKILFQPLKIRVNIFTFSGILKKKY